MDLNTLDEGGQDLEVEEDKGMVRTITCMAGPYQIFSLDKEDELNNIQFMIKEDFWRKLKQAGTELGQAQLKLGLDFTLIFCTIKIWPLMVEISTKI